MRKSIFLLAIIIVAFTATAYSQSVEKTIKWNVHKVVVVPKDEVFNSVTFINYGDTKLEWINADGSIHRRFSITKVNGEELVQHQDGVVQYEVSAGPEKGLVTIQKKDGKIEVHVEIKPSFKDPDLID